MPPWMKNWICDPSFSRWMNDGRMVQTSTTPGKTRALRTQERTRECEEAKSFKLSSCTSLLQFFHTQICRILSLVVVGLHWFSVY